MFGEQIKPYILSVAKLVYLCLQTYSVRSKCCQLKRNKMLQIRSGMSSTKLMCWSMIPNVAKFRGGAFRQRLDHEGSESWMDSWEVGRKQVNEKISFSFLASKLSYAEQLSCHVPHFCLGASRYGLNPLKQWAMINFSELFIRYFDHRDTKLTDTQRNPGYHSTNCCHFRSSNPSS